MRKFLIYSVEKNRYYANELPFQEDYEAVLDTDNSWATVGYWVKKNSRNILQFDSEEQALGTLQKIRGAVFSKLIEIKSVYLF